nr:unnamed protein product [Callosobruchus chinensis]CAH7763552.1 unnamed protein product [Callosobruchus chinensis]
MKNSQIHVSNFVPAQS